MNQSFIDALMHFFSLLLLPLPGRKLSNIRIKLEEYIVRAGIGFPFEECLRIYNTYSGKYFFEFSNNPFGNEEDSSDIHRRLIIEAGHKSRENLLLQERLLVILSLLEFNLHYNENDEITLNHIQELCLGLNISETDFGSMTEFLFQVQPEDSDFDLILDMRPKADELEGEWINENLPGKEETKAQFSDRIKGRLHFRLFESFNYIAFIYTGKENLFLNDNRIYNGFFYSFRRKDRLRFKGLEEIHFEEIESYFNPTERLPKIVLSGKNISYRYSRTNYSIKSFDFHEDSGQLIGIIGNNGVGKSTILKLISGQMEPTDGTLLINGSDLIRNSFKLKSVIGYVPQEDLLFPDLTIYENLYYQAHLCLGNLNRKEIENRIYETAEKLQLTNILNIKAGSAIHHKLTDYQKICINIALELIRKPYILYLDEPLSGLSFSDTRRLISLLKEEVNQGKLIFLTTQLPGTEVFNMFDKIWLIDQDGYLVYNGEPGNSLYFLRNTGLLPYYFIQTRKNEISAEDVIKIIETKKINSDGSPSDERQVSPGAWYDAWRSGSVERKDEQEDGKKPMPIQTSRLPNIEKQFLTYLLRNIRLRAGNLPYLLSVFAGVPILGVILAVVIRTNVHGSYSFAENEFLPLFFFITVNLMFLAGMMAGAEEVYSERKHLRRDLAQNLSLFSYQNAKLIYLLILSFVQAFIYIVLTDKIVGIEGLSFKHTITCFSVSVSGNLAGLVLSSGFRKLKFIYMLIPFILLPSLFYTGFLITYDKTNSFPGNDVHKIPWIAEFTPARWGYEAMMVTQFTENPYNRYFFKNDRSAYNAGYLEHTVLPLLYEALNQSQRYKYQQPDNDSMDASLKLLYNEITALEIQEEIAPFDRLASLNTDEYDSTINEDIYGYLTYLGYLMENRILESEANNRKNNAHLNDSLSGVLISDFKDENHNKTIARLVMGEYPVDRAIISNNRIYKEGSNVFLIPDQQLGKSHFFASQKRFNNQLIPTYRYNLSVIWLLNTLFYTLFLVNILKYVRRIFLR